MSTLGMSVLLINLTLPFQRIQSAMNKLIKGSYTLQDICSDYGVADLFLVLADKPPDLMLSLGFSR